MHQPKSKSLSSPQKAYPWPVEEKCLGKNREHCGPNDVHHLYIVNHLVYDIGYKMDMNA